jgi:hypothetical protein
VAEPGHRDQWGAPEKGWPEFCRFCGKRLRSTSCSFCDMLYEQEDYKNFELWEGMF